MEEVREDEDGSALRTFYRFGVCVTPLQVLITKSKRCSHFRRACVNAGAVSMLTFMKFH